MSLEIGTQAPDFTLKSMTADGLVDVTLSSNFGKQATVLLFFPLAFTSVCTQELCDVTAGLGKFSDLKADVLGISVDSPFAQGAWAKKEGITIRLLSDLNKAVTKAYDVVRYILKCAYEFDTFVHGTKCAAQFSGPIHAGIVHTYKDQRCAPDNIAWEAEKEPLTPWQVEWDDFFDSIRNNKPHNEAKRAALSNLADIMGRAAIHMGRTITWEEAMKSDFRFCPNIDSLTHDSEPPIKADAEGRYPVPIPGQWTEI